MKTLHFTPPRLRFVTGFLVFMLVCNFSSAQIKLLSNGYIGIGTVSPSTNVEVSSPFVLFKSSASTTNIKIQYYNGGIGMIEPTVNNSGYLGFNNAWYDVKSLHEHCVYCDEPSDLRIKKNIRELKNPLEKVLKMKGVMYDLSEDYLYDPSNPVESERLIKEGKDEIGLIAQDVMQIVPELVEYDSLKDEYGIRYTRVIPILIEAIKEQNGKIKNLENKINADGGKPKDAGSPSFNNDPTAFLGKNRPNPFNENTTIDYFLPSDLQQAELNIYNLEGKQLKSIEITERENGQVIIHGSELQPGMYYYSLIADRQVVGTEKMILTD
jgi:hypothetical protein